jgi:glucose/arabinose dehydrogenase
VYKALSVTLAVVTVYADMLILYFTVQEVDKEMAVAYAEEIGALYLETSAKDDTNVQDIFVKLSKCLSVLSLILSVALSAALVVLFGDHAVAVVL